MPDMKDRYFLFPMLDGWTNVFQVPGKRTTGTGAQTYAITGPGWKGTLPAGVKEYKSPTNMVWMLGRIYCTGTPEDYAAVHALQDECKLVPLSAYGKPYTPPPGKVDPSIDMKTAVREQVNRMDAVDVLHAAGAADEDQPAGRGRCADGREARRASASCRARTSTPASSRRTSPSAFPRSPSTASCCSSRSARRVKDINGWVFTTEDRHLRHRLSAARASSPRSASAPTGRRTPSIRPRRRTSTAASLQRREQVRHALPQGPDAAGAGLLVADDV